MKRSHFMALDVDCRMCEFAAGTAGGKLLDRRCVPTTIPALVEAIESVRRPRTLVFEEGPLADWLYRSLLPLVEEIIVCDPRRNAYIAKDGDKDDPIDAVKLLELARGDYLRKVHHPDSEGRALFRRHVAMYHDRVGERQRAGQLVIGYVRQYGIIIQENAFTDQSARAQLHDLLPHRRTVRHHLQWLLEQYGVLAGQEDQARRELVRMASRIDQVRRFTAVPGIHWVRAATFYAYVDTPFRFKSKQALWKYMGIGLERQRSGHGRLKSLDRLGVPFCCNKRLKCMILGAARSAVAAGTNPFADQYRSWINQGRSPRIAIRNVARSQANVLCGMWKQQSDYRPQWVGVSRTS